MRIPVVVELAGLTFGVWGVTMFAKWIIFSTGLAGKFPSLGNAIGTV